MILLRLTLFTVLFQLLRHRRSDEHHQCLYQSDQLSYRSGIKTLMFVGQQLTTARNSLSILTELMLSTLVLLLLMALFEQLHQSDIKFSAIILRINIKTFHLSIRRYCRVKNFFFYSLCTVAYHNYSVEIIWADFRIPLNRIGNVSNEPL